MLGLGQLDELYFTLANLMEAQMNEKPLSFVDGIMKHEEGVDFIPANIELSGVEMSLVNAMSRECVLKNLIRQIKHRYDHILVDCGPSLGMMSVNALVAADSLIIPVQAGYLPAKGLEQLLVTVWRVKRNLNPELKIDGILLTMVGRNNISKNIYELLRETYGNKINIYKTQIPYSVRAMEMSATGKSIFEYEPNGKLASAYGKLAEEVLENEREKSVERSEVEKSR
jgi:chromosome partitioning protein